MCGIFGIWQQNEKALDLALVQRATGTLQHRGPDDEGYLLVNSKTGHVVACGGQATAPSLGLTPITQAGQAAFDLALGFRRLAILDLSPAGHQPMRSADGRWWIVFNGEIYNYVELRRELAQQGHTFHSQSDTEVILAAYQHWGATCLERFNGMWAFAIWDCAQRELFLARDRFGIKPLYYYQAQATFAFASEIKALVGRQKLSPFVPNDKAIYHYLTKGNLPNPQSGETFFKGIHSLPPGHWLRITPEQAEQRRYWQLPLARADTNKADDLIQQYRELFTDAVRVRLRADVPVGTCLSGGLDSSAIVCVVNGLKTEDLQATLQVGTQQKTFSAVYDTTGPFNERPYIERILQTTGVEGNFTIPSLARLRHDLDQFVWHQEEPVISTSVFAQWCVMGLARERGVTVLLDGQGADEVLGGYRPFTRHLVTLMQAGHWRSALAEAQAIQSNTGLRINKTLTRTLTQQAWSACGHTPWVRRSLEPLWQRTALRQAHQIGLAPDFIAGQQAEPPIDWQMGNQGSSLTAYLRHAVEEASLPHLLRYEDRNSMAFSLEGRVPFLDYRLVSFSFEQAIPYSIRQGWTKWILRQAMNDLVPTDIVWRKDKVAFATPEATWLKQWLATEPEIFTDPIHSQPYLDITRLRQRLQGMQQSGQAVPGFWRWINLEKWLQVWSRA